MNELATGFNATVQKLIDGAGSQHKLALMIHYHTGQPVSQSSVSRWLLTPNSVPVDMIETLIEVGAALKVRLTAADLRPDLAELFRT